MKVYFNLYTKAKVKNISQKGDNRNKYMPLKIFYNKARSVILTINTACLTNTLQR